MFTIKSEIKELDVRFDGAYDKLIKFITNLNNFRKANGFEYRTDPMTLVSDLYYMLYFSRKFIMENSFIPDIIDNDNYVNTLINIATKFDKLKYAIKKFSDSYDKNYEKIFEGFQSYRADLINVKFNLDMQSIRNFIWKHLSKFYWIDDEYKRLFKNRHDGMVVDNPVIIDSMREMHMLEYDYYTESAKSV